MFQNRGLEGVLAALGRLLGGSWATLGFKARGRLGRRLGCVLGRPGGVLGGFRASLGAFWGVLGRLESVLGLIFQENDVKLEYSILDGIF